MRCWKGNKQVFLEAGLEISEESRLELFGTSYTRPFPYLSRKLPRQANQSRLEPSLNVMPWYMIGAKFALRADILRSALPQLSNARDSSRISVS